MSKLVASGLLLAACAATLAGCRGGAVTDWRLQQDAESLASLAADGELLADEAAKGEATGPFTRVHSQELSKEAAQLADVLGSAEPNAGLEGPTAQLVATARSTARRLEQLHAHPDDEELARRLADALGKLADRAEKIGKQA